jgi:hypothetical protein
MDGISLKKIIRDAPELLIFPASLIDGDLCLAVLSIVLQVYFFLLFFLLPASRDGDNRVHVVHVKTDEQRNVLLQLESTVQRRERRQTLDWVERRDARSTKGPLDLRHGSGGEI